MEEKKTRGGAREGAGRPKGLNKMKNFLGYKYTEEEYNLLVSILDKYKKKNNNKTTLAILEIFKQAL